MIGWRWKVEGGKPWTHETLGTLYPAVHIYLSWDLGDSGSWNVYLWDLGNSRLRDLGDSGSYNLYLSWDLGNPGSWNVYLMWDLGNPGSWNVYWTWDPGNLGFLKCILDMGPWEPRILICILDAGPWEPRILKCILDTGPWGSWTLIFCHGTCLPIARLNPAAHFSTIRTWSGVIPTVAKVRHIAPLCTVLALSTWFWEAWWRHTDKFCSFYRKPKTFKM